MKKNLFYIIQLLIVISLGISTYFYFKADVKESTRSILKSEKPIAHTYLIADIITLPGHWTSTVPASITKPITFTQKIVVTYNNICFDINEYFYPADPFPDDIKNLVMFKVRSEIWDDTIGTSIEVVHDKLIVVAHPTVQKEVKVFLDSLRP